VTWSFERSSRASTFERPGNTPLVRIDSLSDALGVEILGKAEVCIELEHALSMFLTFVQFVVFESRRECQGPRCSAQ
jgi:hypothetical protein